MKTVWIVDDDRSIRWILEKALTAESIAHRSFASGDEMLVALSDQTNMAPDALMTDIRMPGISGIELLTRLQQQQPTLPVVIMTAYADLENAVSAFENGAFDYLAKPFDIDEAVALIQRMLASAPARNTQTPSYQPKNSLLLGQAPAMQTVFRAIGRLSNSNATVLITGESGTGKELVARALHQHSAQSNGPFIAINTAAIPQDLLESELFGHDKGAFTGATSQRSGRFEQAHLGTLFLDEIGDMPIQLQSKLLRVLSDGHFYRVGGHQPIHADVRIIAATHQDLAQAVQQKRFREDLFHRLNVIHLPLPPLRQRREDIALLAEHFLHSYSQKLKTAQKVLTPPAMQQLQQHDFHGNVRQLENLCHWLTVMSPNQHLGLSDLPPEFQPSHALPTTTTTTSGDSAWQQVLAQAVQQHLSNAPGDVFNTLLADFEKTVLLEALQHTDGRRIEAARQLGIGRNTFSRKLQQLLENGESYPQHDHFSENSRASRHNDDV